MASETTARQFVFAAIIFSGIIAGAFTLISFSLPSDNQNFDTYNDTYNKFADIETSANQVRSGIEDAQPERGVLGFLNGLIESSWGAISGVWNSFSTINTIVDDASTDGGALGVISPPAWFTTLIGLLLAVTIAFAVMAAIFKWHI